MDEGATQEIIKLAQSAGDPKVVDETVAGLRYAYAGQLGGVPKDPHTSDLELQGLSDVVALTQNETWTDEPTVFVGEDAVRVVMQKADRRIRAVMALDHSPQWLRLQGMAREALSGTPAELVERLRFELFGLGDSLTRLIAVLRNVTFESTSSSGANIQHGQNSMGRSLNAKADKAADIPESIEVIVRPYLAPGCAETYTVQLGILIRPADGTVSLQPYAGEVERVTRLARLAVKAALTGRLDGSSDPIRLVEVYGGNCDQP